MVDKMDCLAPPLSTVRQTQYYEMGIRAATTLFERIQQHNLPQRQFIIQPQLMMRGTTVPYEEVTVLRNSDSENR